MKMTGHLLVGEWELKKKKVIPIKPEVMKDRITAKFIGPSHVTRAH